MKFIKKIGELILGLLLLLSVLCGILSFATGRGGVSNIFGYKPLFIPTGSMSPTIEAGSIVLGQLTRAEDLSIGDIAVYEHKESEKLICHRLIAICDNGDLIFKGDHNLTADAPVQPEQIRYRVAWY